MTAIIANDDGSFERDVDDPELRGVEAYRTDAADWDWEVTVFVAEYLRDDPLEDELRRDVATALSTVAGVTEVAEEDREVWLVRGGADGRALVTAVGTAVDALGPRAEVYLDGMIDDR